MTKINPKSVPYIMEKVINSCVTFAQLEVAVKYCHLLLKRSKAQEIYNRKFIKEKFSTEDLFFYKNMLLNLRMKKHLELSKKNLWH